MSSLDRMLDTDHLASTMAARRSAQGLSFREVAKQTGLSFSTVQRVEAGHMPDLVSLLRLALWLEVDPAEFFLHRETRPETTLERISYLLYADPAIPGLAADRLIGLVALAIACFAEPAPGGAE